MLLEGLTINADFAAMTSELQGQAVRLVDDPAMTMSAHFQNSTADSLFQDSPSFEQPVLGCNIAWLSRCVVSTPKVSPGCKVKSTGVKAVSFALQLERGTAFQLAGALLAMLPAPKSKVRHDAVESASPPPVPSSLSMGLSCRAAGKQAQTASDRRFPKKPEVQLPPTSPSSRLTANPNAMQHEVLPILWKRTSLAVHSPSEALQSDARYLSLVPV